MLAVLTLVLPVVLRVVRRALQQRAVKLLRRKVGCHVREDNVTEWVGHGAKDAPNLEIRGAKDRVNGRRTGDGKLKRAQRLSQADELKR